MNGTGMPGGFVTLKFEFEYIMAQPLDVRMMEGDGPDGRTRNLSSFYLLKAPLYSKCGDDLSV
jgi:hypothetical protein